MVTVLTLWVPGAPKTKGSLTFRGGHATESVIGSPEWRAAIATVARREWAGREPLTCALSVSAVFVLPGDPTAPGAGDVDKLARNLLDALAMDVKRELKSAGVYVNDNQVVELSCIKIGCGSGLPAGMALLVEPVDADEVGAARHFARVVMMASRA